MYIARILYPVEVLGPGKRIGIWFCGCPHKCKGCSNPELWDFKEQYNVSFKTVIALIDKIASENKIDGFTITGGDPMFQANELKKLISYLKEISSDILVYTGYEIDEISKELLEDVSVLIDGKYIEERNNSCLLRGSDNQKIHIINEIFREKYEKYLNNSSNQIQNFNTTDGIISVGIHKPHFLEELNIKVSKKGLNFNE